MAETTSTEGGETPPLTVDMPDAEFGDDAAEDLVAVGCGSIEVLEYLDSFKPSRLAEQGYRQEHVDRLEAARETFTDILDRHDVEAFQDDVSAIDDDLLDEAAETFTPVAGLFLDEFDLPVDQSISITEFLPFDVNWGGS